MKRVNSERLLPDKKNIFILVLVVIAICFYLTCYLTHGAVPDNHQGSFRGWWGWFDQGEYLKSAEAFSRMDLTPAKHLYPIGYPLLGALFYRLLPMHPFLIPNVFLFLLLLYFLYRIYSRFLDEIESLIVVGCMVVFNPIIIENLIIPWTLIPSAVLIVTSIYLLVFRDLDGRSFLWSGLLTGASYFFRPGDWLFIGPIALAGLFITKDWKKRLYYSGLFILTFSLMLMLSAVINYRIYGAFIKTPYNVLSAAIGFSIPNVILKAFSIGINAETIYGIKDRMLLDRFPWLLLVIPGIIYAYKKNGIRILGLLGSILLTYVFYLAYNDFDAQVLYNTKAIRYFTWTFPFLWLFAYLTIRKSWSVLSKKAFVAYALTPVILMQVLSINVQRLETTHDMTDRYDTLKIVHTENKETIRFIYLGNMPKEGYWNKNLYPQIVIDGTALQHFKDYRGIYRKDGAVLFLNKPAQASTINIGWEGFDPKDRARVTRMELYDAGIGLKKVFTNKYRSRQPQFAGTQVVFAEHDLNRLPSGAKSHARFASLDDDLTGHDRVIGSITNVIIKSEDTVLFDKANSQIELDMHGKEYGMYFWVCPAQQQVQYANIISNHKEGFLGFTIEQNGSRMPVFNFSIGNGKSWKGIQNISIQPLIWNLIVLNFTATKSKLIVYSDKMNEYNLDEPPLMSNDLPLSLGNWHMGDRPFHGTISSITFSNSSYDLQDIGSIVKEKPGSVCTDAL